MLLDRFKLDGKVAVVTGSRRGLGRGMAIALAEPGADTAGFGRHEPSEST
jgi:2-deoxy-D-gluconate 3-dehydrogenase